MHKSGHANLIEIYVVLELRHFIYNIQLMLKPAFWAMRNRQKAVLLLAFCHIDELWLAVEIGQWEIVAACWKQLN